MYEHCFVIPVDIRLFKTPEFSYPDTETEHEEYRPCKHIIFILCLLHDLITLSIRINKVIVVFFLTDKIRGSYRSGDIGINIVMINGIVEDLIEYCFGIIQSPAGKTLIGADLRIKSLDF